MLRFITAGESHGPGLVAVVEGLPAGIPFLYDELKAELARRTLGFGRGPRMKIEKDQVEIMGGVRHGRTLGSPLAVVIHNTEFPEKWAEEMSPHPGTAKHPKTTPRPGHADLVGMQKYDTHDARDILERASARETAARTVVGYAAKAMLSQLGIDVFSHVVEIGGVAAPTEPLPKPSDLEAIDASPVRVFDRSAEQAMVETIEAARADRDTLGGVVEVLTYGLVPGVGSHVHWDRKLDAEVAEALMSIQAIKGVEIGDGFRTARRRGSEAHDEIFHDEAGFSRMTNKAGGTEGGMSVGDVLRVRAAMKPISTVGRGLRTVDVSTKQAESAFYERSDVVAVPAAGVVAEQMVAIVVAREIQRKFGGDTVGDLQTAWNAYRARLDAF
jgi:chorismate synthase